MITNPTDDMPYDSGEYMQCPKCKGSGKDNSGDALDCKMCDGEGGI